MRHVLRLAVMLLFCSASWAPAADSFKLVSPDIKPGDVLTIEQVFNGFGCSGENISPALKWSGVPAGTKSFALTVYDPDAPTGSGWWHWVVYNIPATCREVTKGAGAVASSSLPQGAIQGRTDFGTAGFGGACPPTGDKPHRYIFTIFALKVEKLEVPTNATAALIGFMVNGNKLAQASFTATYGR